MLINTSINLKHVILQILTIICELVKNSEISPRYKEIFNFQTICSAIRDVLGIEGPDSKRTIYLPPRDHLATFLEKKAILGPHSDALEFEPLPV